MQIAIGQRSNVARRLANIGMNETILAEYIVFAEYGHHDVVSQYFDGAARYKIESQEEIAPMDERVAGRRMSGLEFHRERAQAARAGAFERRARVE
jgi:hypothetical protein